MRLFLLALMLLFSGTHVTEIHAVTDHGWSDHRIYLETTIINWLGRLNSSSISYRPIRFQKGVALRSSFDSGYRSGSICG
jgi:hypothetical protein